MKCCNELCIYNKDNECKLSDEIEINTYGMCDSCITVAINDSELQLYKNEQLKRLDDEFNTIIS